MSAEQEDEAAGEVAAMQFAGGLSIAQLAVEWDRDTSWIEAAVRRELLKSIPVRDGGRKSTRIAMQAKRKAERRLAQIEALRQQTLGW